MMKGRREISARAGRRAEAAAASRLVAVGLAVLLASWSMGCKGEEVVEAPAAPEGLLPRIPFMPLLPAMDLQDIELLLQDNARGWQSFSADCQGIIRNRQIQAPNNEAHFSEGHIWYEKPGRVHLWLGYDGKTRLKVVGNGTKYRADLRVFDDIYTGSYSESPLPSPGRISLLPPDLAAAIDPIRVIVTPGADLAPTLVQWEQLTGLLMLGYDEESGSRIWPVSSVWINRRTREVETIEKYRAPGMVSARIRYFDLSAASTPEENVVKVPHLVAIQYPEEQTTISLTLSNFKLNPKLPPDVFSLAD
jgi:hypothetical protein